MTLGPILFSFGGIGQDGVLSNRLRHVKKEGIDGKSGAGSSGFYARFLEVAMRAESDDAEVPEPRYGHVCYTFGNTLVIAGGRGKDG